MRLKDSLINMLGEFVGLNKTPDFKLRQQSTQFIAEAVAVESRQFLFMFDPSAVGFFSP
ncbi:unnamed protein product [Dracunculus medinensis]|uniref:Phospholipid scramblase n=1 Tax=Dracunculus medinensis TaxID=318479 RepID=A0A0N4U0Z1_DRAME|nr:unnamed protein product [Dracunculus medinensis]